MNYTYMAQFGLASPIPRVPLQGAPDGVGTLVRGSQLGTLVGAGLGIEKTLKDAEDEDMPLPKTLVKGAVNTLGGATLGTLSGLSGGVLLNRARSINNSKALNYANKYVFGEEPTTSSLQEAIKNMKRGR